MRRPSEHPPVQQVAQRLASLLGMKTEMLRVEAGHNTGCPDAIISFESFRFAVRWKESGSAGSVAKAIERVCEQVAKQVNAIPLLVVPYMGDAGRKLCFDADIPWIDLSGNARIFASGLRILVEGKPNLYKNRGRPSSVFAPKSSRIPRWLLMHPDQSMTQREIARATDTDEGYTSKITRRLMQDGLIVQDETGAIKARDNNLLLDAWKEVYDFSKHHIVQGHIAARSGDALLRQLSDSLKEMLVGYAATGLAASWLMDRFAAFRTTTVYLAEEPSPELLASLSFSEETRGANVWLVVPNDQGVFQGASEIDGIMCVHPVQAYLDLSAHPERAAEAAKSLRASHLRWDSNA